LKRVKLEKHIKLVGGGTPSKKKSEYWNGDIPWASVKDFKSKNLIETIDKITKEGLENSSSKLVEKGNLIIATRMAVGKAVMTEIDVAINQDLKAVYTSDDLDNKYLQYFFDSQTDYFERTGKGATVKGIKIGDIQNLEIPLPTLSEQKAIVAKLDRAQRLIDIDREMLAKYDELIQSVFLEMFGEDLKEKRNTKTLKEIAEFIDYRGQSPDKAESGIPLITAKNVKEAYLNEDPKEYMNVNSFEDWMTRGVPKPGDVLFTTEAPLGNVCIIPRLEKFAIAQRLICFQLSKDVIAEYLMYYLLSDFAKFELDKRATGSTAKGIGSARLKKVPVVIPELEKQENFKNLYQKIIKEKVIIEKSLKKSEELFSSLVQGVFG